MVQRLTQAQGLRDRVAVLQELRAAGCRVESSGVQVTGRGASAHYKDNPAAAAAAIACLPPSATAISTASAGGASAALDISSHPGCDLLSPKVILQQAALSGGAISRAAVNRRFRLPPATTDNMCVPGLVSHTILPSSAHPIRSSYIKQPCQEAPSHEQRCTDSSACPPPPLMPFLDSFWELAGLLKLGGIVLVVGWEGQW
ncbi:unnamed protein product [Closterium sp. NIES-64]|nr:unnamed protein product [Closterium sp. NIES-64]